MKVMTFNIQHCNYFPEGKILFEPFIEEINNSDCDIIGLNEVRGRGFLKDYTDQTRRLSEGSGLYSFFAPAIKVRGLAPYGNALLCRYPIISAEIIKIPDPEKRTGKEAYETRCILKAEIQAEEKYTVFVTHMGLNKDERENAVRMLLENAGEERTVIMGDFNCTPESEELKPLFDKFICTDKSELTFPSDKPVKKIDYILLSRDMEVINKGTSKRIISDHLSQWAVIKEK